jgi:hypothetical protein
VLSIGPVLLQPIIANRLCAVPDRCDQMFNNQSFLTNCCAVSDLVENFVNPAFLHDSLFFYLRLDRLHVIANISRIPTFD